MNVGYGLDDEAEYRVGTNPNNSDTYGDFIKDEVFRKDKNGLT